MNELKALIWLEWKKSPTIVGGILTVLAIMFMVLIFGGATKYAYEIASMMLVSGFGYMLGFVFLVIFAYRLGKDFRSDEFAFLLMSPVKPWKHIMARLLFVVSILGVYFFAIALIVISFIYKYWTGSLGAYIGAVALVMIQHLTMVIIPLLCFLLLVSMIVASYKKRSRWLVQLLMGVALVLSMNHGAEKLIDTNGMIFPVVELGLDDSIAFDRQILEQMLIDGTIKTNSENPKDIYLDGKKLKFGGKMPLHIEPQIIMLLLSGLFLFGTVRVWNEVEL